jgi:hypothetical protein
VHFDDEADQPVQLQPAAAVPNEHSAPGERVQDAEQGPGGLDAGAEEAYMPGGKEAQPRPPNPHDHEPEGVPGHSQRVDTQGHAHLETGGRTVGGGQGGRTVRPDNRPRRGDSDVLSESQNGGSNASQPDNGGKIKLSWPLGSTMLLWQALGATMPFGRHSTEQSQRSLKCPHGRPAKQIGF